MYLPYTEVEKMVKSLVTNIIDEALLKIELENESLDHNVFADQFEFGCSIDNLFTIDTSIGNIEQTTHQRSVKSSILIDEPNFIR